MQAARPPDRVNACKLGPQRVPGGGVVRPAAHQHHGPGPLGAHQRDVLPLGVLVGGGAGMHTSSRSASATSISPAAIEEKYGSEISRSATPIIVL